VEGSAGVTSAGSGGAGSSITKVPLSPAGAGVAAGGGAGA